MVLANTTLVSFSSGELSPKLRGRFDIAQYYSGAERLENYISETQGPAKFRTGSRFVAETKNSNKAFLTKFEVEGDVHILEITAGFFRFFIGDIQLESGGSPVEITNPYSESELFELQYAQDKDTMYFVHPEHSPMKLERTTPTTFTFTIHTPTGINLSGDNRPRDGRAAAGGRAARPLRAASRQRGGGWRESPHPLWFSGPADHRDALLGVGV